MDEEYYFDEQYTPPEGNEVVSEPANYVPPGYSNPAWDTEEHFSYQPPNEYPEVSTYNQPTEDVISSRPDTNQGDMSLLSRWTDKDKKEDNLDSLRRISGGNDNGGSLRRNSSTVTNSTSTTTRTPTKPLPIFSGPSLNIPEWDPERIRRLRQSKSFYGTGSLRDIANRGIISARSSQTGYGARQALREALSGYGKGLSNIMKEADTEATNEYGREYTAGANKAKQEYDAKFQVANTMYQAALQEFLNSFTTTTNNQQSSSTVGGSY